MSFCSIKGRKFRVKSLLEHCKKLFHYDWRAAKYVSTSLHLILKLGGLLKHVAETGPLCSSGSIGVLAEVPG